VVPGSVLRILTEPMVVGSVGAVNTFGNTPVTVMRSTSTVPGWGPAPHSGGAGVFLTTPLQIPLTLPNTQITVANGGGVRGLQPVGPQTPNFTDVQVFTGTGTNGGLNGATCFSWVSTGAGDQQINVTYAGFDGVSHNVNWDVDNDGNGEGAAAAARPNKALIKEWNVLENSTVSINGQPQLGPSTGVTTTVATVGVPAFINNGCTFGVASVTGLVVGQNI